MARLGLLINYRYCTGCHSCEVACQMEQGLPIGQFGIKIAEIGPWKIGEDRWQYSYVPIPTEQCNLCGKRVAQGKLPACVHHCQAAVMRYGKVDELAKEIGDKRQMALFTP
ncbi:MAG: oxidoreductase [Eggerthellaceae bacterium]|nr:oxidoreductase [Eggerthellaceae bacterium]MDR2715797.1 hypothetical protein [Coriobacteriaceae bacterium]